MPPDAAAICARWLATDGLTPVVSKTAAKEAPRQSKGAQLIKSELAMRASRVPLHRAMHLAWRRGRWVRRAPCLAWPRVQQRMQLTASRPAGRSKQLRERIRASHSWQMRTWALQYAQEFEPAHGFAPTGDSHTAADVSNGHFLTLRLLFSMESTLEVARRAVEADTRRDWASGAKRRSAAPCCTARRARCLCARCVVACDRSSAWRLRNAVRGLCAPSEAVARHVLIVASVPRRPCAQPTRCTCRLPLSLTPLRSTRAPRARRRSCRVRLATQWARACARSSRARAPQLSVPRLRSTGCARRPSRRRCAAARQHEPPRPPRAHAVSNAGAGARHGNHGAGGAGWRRAGVAGHAGSARSRRRADDGRRCRTWRRGWSRCARPANGALPRGSQLASRLTQHLRRPSRQRAPLRTRRRATTTWATSRAPPASKRSLRWKRPKARPCGARRCKLCGIAV